MESKPGNLFDEVDKLIIEYSADGASPELIAYRLNKKGFSATESYVLERINALSDKIRLEVEDRKLRARLTLEKVIARLEKYISILEGVLEASVKKSKTRSAVDAVKELNQAIMRMADLVFELKMQASKSHAAIDSRVLMKEIKKMLPEIIDGLSDSELGQLGLVRVAPAD